MAQKVTGTGWNFYTHILTIAHTLMKSSREKKNIRGSCNVAVVLNPFSTRVGLEMWYAFLMQGWAQPIIEELF